MKKPFMPYRILWHFIAYILEHDKILAIKYDGNKMT